MPKAQTHPTDSEGKDSTETEASPQEQAAQTRAVEGGATSVTYVGAAGTRQISKADWKAAGIEDQDTVTWDDSNDYTVSASQFTEPALAILKRDRNLKIK